MAKYTFDTFIYENYARKATKVEITIDWNGLAHRLAQKALRNKSRKSRAFQGEATVKLKGTPA